MRIVLKTTGRPQAGAAIQGHPLTRGLLGFWALGESGQKPLDSLTGTYATLVNGGTMPTPVVTPYGGGMNWTDTTNLIYYGLGTSPYLQPSLPISFFAVLKQTAATPIFQSTWGTLGSGNFSGCGFDTSGNAVRIIIGDNAGITASTHTTILQTGAILDTTSWWRVSGSLRSSSDGSMYVNGIPVSSSFGANAVAQPVYASNDQAAIGKTLVEGGGGRVNGTYVCFAMWNRSLTDQEHFQIGSDPWCMFGRDGDMPSGTPPAPGNIDAPFIAATTSVYSPSLSTASTIGTIEGQGGGIGVG